MKIRPLQNLTKSLLAAALFFIGASASAQSLIQISIIRTSLDSASFNALSTSLEGTVTNYATGVTGFTFSVGTSANRIDFNYSFPNGYDYPFWTNWRDNVVAILNANTPPSVGYRWEISVDGAVSNKSNPLANVSWLPDATLFGDEFVYADALGFIAAPSLDPDNGFWGYFFDVDEFEWAWIVNGYYYDSSNQTWYFNAPGSSWFYEFNAGGGQWRFFPPED